MGGAHTISVAEDDADIRLDRWFRRHFPSLPHGHLEKLLRRGEVRVEGRRAKSNTRLRLGQAIRVPPLAESATRSPREWPPPPQVRAADQKAIRNAVIYRDDWILAIDKPAGLAVQGGTRQPRHLDAMLEALRFGAAERPRLVHRLDRETSGVLLLARTGQAARALTAAFRRKDVRKLYWATVAGVPRPGRGRIDMPLAKRPGRAGDKVAPDMRGRAAVTLYAVVARVGWKAAWLALVPETGRTHQLRAHCAALGTPILGDGKYGGKRAFLDRPALPKKLHLHAREIAVPHPTDGTTLRVEAPLPPHMAETWRTLGFDVDAWHKVAAEFKF